MKILVIEDSEVYRKLLERYLKKNLVFVECKSVGTFSELKQIKNDFDLYLVDFILPDAQGEQIKYLLERKKEIIVLTQYEDDFLKQSYRKDIIDYVIKDDFYTIDYLIKFIKSLNKNSKRNVLVVDDSLMMRKLQKKLLSKIKLNVTEASNGCEALERIKNESFDLIITDLHMPKMDGAELIKNIRMKYSLNELPIMLVSSNQDEKEMIKCLKLGANDYIKKPFSIEELKVRVNNILELYDGFRKAVKNSQIDKLTGVFNRNYLESDFENIFNSFDNKSIAMLDIDYFKRINDTYGHQKGDEVLKHFAKKIISSIRKSDIVIRYGGEEFLIFMPNTAKHEAYIALQKIKNSLTPCGDIKFTFSAGIADEGETLAEMIKIADERLYKAKKEGRNRIIFK
jgi:diguanylate cyclase (GGDEF)-like protein